MEEAEFVEHGSCDECGSSDANALYTDGHTHCFSCNKTTQPIKGEATSASPFLSSSSRGSKGMIQGEALTLSKRGITETTARKFGYLVGEYSGKPVQIATYYDKDGKRIAQKLRDANKKMVWLGEPKQSTLFGQNLWKGGGKKVVVTEGEIDAMSLSQLQDNKWPVVSVKNGASGARKDLAKNIEWLETFEQVILMFDMDEPGQDAATECAQLFTPGKCAIAKLPLNDANECLTEGRGSEVVRAMWDARPYRPDGIVSVSDVREKALIQPSMGLPWYLETMTAVTLGRRYGEVYGFGAGSGVGKSDLIAEQVAFDVKPEELGGLGMKVGVLFLEQQPSESVQRVAGKIDGKLYHIPDSEWSTDDLASTLDTYLDERLFLFDHFGETEWDVIKSRIRYMAVSLGIRSIYIDHLTAMADTTDERASLEQIMKEMAGLAQELQVMIHFVSHLATPDGKPHEEGGQVQMRHFKGARAIAYWSFFMFGLERNTQAEDAKERQKSILRILKDRLTGRSAGVCIPLKYDTDSGRLTENDEDLTDGFDDDGDF